MDIDFPRPFQPPLTLIRSGGPVPILLSLSDRIYSITRSFGGSSKTSTLPDRRPATLSTSSRQLLRTRQEKKRRKRRRNKVPERVRERELELGSSWRWNLCVSSSLIHANRAKREDRKEAQTGRAVNVRFRMSLHRQQRTRQHQEPSIRILGQNRALRGCTARCKLDYLRLYGNDRYVGAQRPVVSILFKCSCTASCALLLLPDYFSTFLFPFLRVTGTNGSEF